MALRIALQRRVFVKKALMSMTYDGMWKIRFDDKGEAIFNFDVVRLKKGGALEVQHIGTGIHFVQEDSGPAIGIAIARWREQQGLVKEPSRQT